MATADGTDIFEIMSKKDVLDIFNNLATPENISNINTQLASKAQQTGYIDSRQDLDKLFETIGEENDKHLFIQKLNADRYNIYVHHSGNLYQEHRFSRESTYFDPNQPKPANGYAFANELCNIVKINVQGDIYSNDPTNVKTGTWTSSVASTYYSNTTGDTFKFTFYGHQCRLDLYKTTNAGIVRVQIDGQDNLCNLMTLDANGQCTIDTYSATAGTSQYMLADNLQEGLHTVTITITGTKNASSTDYRGYVGELRYWQNPYSKDFTISQLILDESTAISCVPDIVKELAINVGGKFRGFYHSYCYPSVSGAYDIYVDGVKGDIATGIFVACKDVTFVQQLVLTDDTTPFANLTTISNYTQNGIVIKNNFTATRDFTSDTFYPAMGGFYGSKAITSNAGQKILVKDESQTNMNPDTSSVLTINTTNNFIGLMQFLRIDIGIIDNPVRPHFILDRAQGYPKFYFLNNQSNFSSGYTYESIVKHSIRKCFGATPLLY